MKLVLPNYYKDFKCKANKCNDSCCSAGWEIDIDKKTLDYYKKIDGEFGKKLKDSIITKSPPHFKLLSNNNCPFLNNKLCEIYIKLGENYLCDICKEHPRFYEFFDNFKEGGIGLCCEEASRIILSQTKPFSTYEIQTPNFDFDPYNIEIFDYLYKARTNIIKYLENENFSITSRIRNVLWYSHTLQQNINFNLLDNEKIIEIKNYSKTDIKPVIEFYSKLEPNNKTWIDTLIYCIKNHNIYIEKKEEFEKSNPILSIYLKNIAIYFIWRYFLKGTFDNDVLSKIKLMYISIATINYLYFFRWYNNKTITLEDCIEITKKYSEEIEYSEENIQKITNESYNLDCLSTEYLLGII